MVVIVFGLPGSGKTFFAKQLATRMGAVYMGSDAVRSTLAQKEKYSDGAKMEVYQQMLLLMQQALTAGQDVVLDATFYKEHVRDMFATSAAKLNSRVCFIETVADEQTVKMRTAEKRPDSDANFEVYLALKAAFEPLGKEHLIIHTDRGDALAEALATALKYIQDTNGRTADKAIGK